ncbi:hypothetical protein AAG906_024388 [Vitis piasezkii]
MDVDLFSKSKEIKHEFSTPRTPQHNEDSIEDNPKDLEITKDNPNDILERDMDPNKDDIVPLDDTFEEMRNKHRFRLPKNHPISNVIGNVNELVVTRRQSRLNEMDLICYTSQLEPKNVDGVVGVESWTTPFQEELNQFTKNDMWYLVPRPKDKHVIVFGATSSDLALDFAEEMKTKFEMSMVGELTFFLGL